MPGNTFLKVAFSKKNDDKKEVSEKFSILTNFYYK